MRPMWFGLAALLAGAAAPAHAQDFWAEAGKPYAGVTIHGVTESTPSSNYVRDVLGPQFEKETGIKVALESTSWDQMFDKSIKDMEAKSGIYDFVYIEQDIIYSYLARGFLVDVTQATAKDPKLKAPAFDPAQFTSFIEYFKDPKTQDLFAVPMESFLKTYLYRKDLFEDAKNKDAFKAKYGYDLAPAKTHAQYRDIAEFFTQLGQDEGEDLWGTTVQAASGHPASYYELVETIFPTFGVYNWGINLDTYAATVEHGGTMNSPEAKKAMAWWLGLLKFAPPESTSSTWDEVAASFAAGRAAQGPVYGENAAWIATDDTKSTVVGKVGVALPPVEPGVMEAAQAGKGYIGYYDGGAFGVPTTAKNQAAALLFLQYVGQQSAQPDWAVKAARITLTSTFDDPAVKAQDQKVDGYYTLMKQDGPLFAGAPPFPFHAQLREAIAPIVYNAIIGNVSPDDALDQMAAKSEEVLKTLGYRKG